MLDDPGPGGLPVGVVDHCVPLVIRLGQNLLLKGEGAVFEAAQPVPKVGIQRAGINHPLCQDVQPGLTGQVIHPQPQLGPRQHPGNQGGVPLLRHPLVPGIEIVVIIGQPDRQPPDDKGRQLPAGAAPLLFGVALDQLFVEVPPHQGNSLLFQVAGLAGDLPALNLQLGLGLLGSDSPPHLIKSIHVKRQRIELPFVIGHRAVDKPVEPSETGDILPDCRVVCMEDMGAVFVDGDPLHLLGVEVAPDLGALFHHQDSFSLLHSLLGKNGPIEPRAHHQIIVQHCLFLSLPVQ